MMNNNQESPRRSRSRRIAALAAIALVAAVAPPPTSASSVSVPRHVVALAGGNSGRMMWIDWVEQSDSTSSEGSDYSVRFCNTFDCRDVDTQVMTSVRRSDYIEYLAVAAVPQDLGDDPIEVRVARGHRPSSSDWSAASPRVLPFEPPQLPEDPAKPLFDIVVLQQGRDYIDIGFCFNRNDDSRLVRSGSNLVFHAIKPRATFEISADGRLVTSGSFGVGAIDGAWWAMCEESYADQVRVQNLVPGTTYRASIRLETENHPVLTAERDFTMPGGCPTEAPQYPAPGLPFSHAVVDENNRFIHHLSWVFSSRSARNRGVWPTYTSPGKIFPTSGAYEYLPEIDDWALHLDEVVTIGKQELIRFTAFKDCSPELVDMLISTIPDPLTGEDTVTSCQVVEGLVQPTRIGQCFLRIAVTRRNVQSSGLPKFASSRSTSQTMVVPLIINSIGTSAAPGITSPQTSASTTLNVSPPGSLVANPPGTTSTAPPTRIQTPESTMPTGASGSATPTAPSRTIPSTAGSNQAPSTITPDTVNQLLSQPVRKVLTRSVGTKISLASLMRSTGVRVVRNSRTTIKVAPQSGKICRVDSRYLIVVREGICGVSLTISQSRRRPYGQKILVISSQRS